MRRTHVHGAILALPLLAMACGGTQPAAPPVTPEASAPKGHMNMLQLMRAFPFIHSNVLFDAQGRDPEGPEKKQSMSYSVYRWYEADTYAGWPGVENSALALTEMAPILLTPRACANGKPAPVDRDDWKAAVAGLVKAGEAAYAAAQTKDLDKITEVTENITSACSYCHDIYRDVDLSGGTRCSVPTE